MVILEQICWWDVRAGADPQQLTPVLHSHTEVSILWHPGILYSMKIYIMKKYGGGGPHSTRQ